MKVGLLECNKELLMAGIFLVAYITSLSVQLFCIDEISLKRDISCRPIWGTWWPIEGGADTSLKGDGSKRISILHIFFTFTQPTSLVSRTGSTYAHFLTVSGALSAESKWQKNKNFFKLSQASAGSFLLFLFMLFSLYRYGSLFFQIVLNFIPALAEIG